MNQLHLWFSRTAADSFAIGSGNEELACVETREVAQRIVACVNACQGSETHDVVQFGPGVLKTREESLLGTLANERAEQNERFDIARDQRDAINTLRERATEALAQIARLARRDERGDNCGEIAEIAEKALNIQQGA